MGQKVDLTKWKSLETFELTVTDQIVSLPTEQTILVSHPDSFHFIFRYPNKINLNFLLNMYKSINVSTLSVFVEELEVQSNFNSNLLFLQEYAFGNEVYKLVHLSHQTQKRKFVIQFELYNGNVRSSGKAIKVNVDFKKYTIKN